MDRADPTRLAALVCALPGELVLDVATDAVLRRDAGRGDGHAVSAGESYLNGGDERDRNRPVSRGPGGGGIFVDASRR